MKPSFFIFGVSLVGIVDCLCPFAELKRSGVLTDEDWANFEQVKRDPAAAGAFVNAHQAKINVEKRDEKLQPEERGLVGPTLGGILDLPLGGGLLNGVLQPLTGALKNVELPIPQPQGFKEIPGDDPLHQFKRPGKTDIRGICPTLNTLANYGYLSRDGVISFAEAANAVQTVFGFDYSLSVFLSAVGLLAGGDLVTGKYTTGGADPRVPNTIGPAGGLSKHGVFEIDGSITREDINFGNNANFLLQRWNEYVAEAKKHGGLFGFKTQAVDNGLRYDNSLKTNPNFYAGIVWFVVSHAERVFVYTGLANGTEIGIGPADYKNIAPWFLNETIPPNWFRRGTPFTLPQAFQEAGKLFIANPRPLGGNEGVGNFVPLDLKYDLTKTGPSKIGCFILETLLDAAPGQLAPGLLAHWDLATGFLKGVVAPFFINDGFFNCPAATDFVKPGQHAGSSKNGKSSSGSPINGAYPGIGVIKPDSQPS